MFEKLATFEKFNDVRKLWSLFFITVTVFYYVYYVYYVYYGHSLQMRFYGFFGSKGITRFERSGSVICLYFMFF
ncbi:Uncharacterised protein [Yersinia similis]|nr:Uncharacterised protein [Yersinia similis]